MQYGISANITSVYQARNEIESTPWLYIVTVLRPVIVSLLFFLIKRLHASRFPTHNAVQPGSLFEL